MPPAALSRILGLAGFLHHAIRPDVHVTVAPEHVVRLADGSVTTRDGTVLKADVYADSRDPTPRPAILCAHPYGKDNLPKRRGPVWLVSPQYRMFRQPERITFSEFTGWEAPDPAFWVDQGYVVVNADLRGCGKSDGRWNPLSEQEGEDVHDIIEWVAAQPWCDGNVGMLGVSYLAITQYRAAATNPPHLKAICPWEGFTDLYRDFARPGGVLEVGFLKLWSSVTRKRVRTDVDLAALARDHATDDEVYASRRARLANIRVPMLVCGSFSDHCLHTRGSFEAFRWAGSTQKWLWTHRGGKWSTFYGEAAKADQLAFFDHFLKGRDNGWDRRPPVRLATQDSGRSPEHVEAFPPDGVEVRDLFLTTTGGLEPQPPAEGAVDWRPDSGPLRFAVAMTGVREFVGPMELSLWISLPPPDGADTLTAGDADLFVAVAKYRAGQRVGYQGSYGFADDFVTHGILRVSQRHVDAEASARGRPVLSHDRSEPIPADRPVHLRIPLLASATAFGAGEVLVVELHTGWFWPRRPVYGQFPADYDSLASPARVTVHVGGTTPSALLLPVHHRRDVH